MKIKPAILPLLAAILTVCGCADSGSPAEASNLKAESVAKAKASPEQAQAMEAITGGEKKKKGE